MANHWTAFYWRDYIADTGHLTLAQHGAYLLLMAHYYMTGKPIPANASVLHRVCRCTTDAERAATEQVLAEFFTLDGDVYRHPRIDAELAKAVDISGKRRAAAQARHLQMQSKCNASAPANAVQVHTQPQPQPQKKTPCTSAKASVLDDSTEVDPRHAPVRQLIQRLHLQQFRVKAEWDGSEAKALDRLLSANPAWAQEQLELMVQNRFASEDVTSARPRKWISSLGGYMAGPLDRFGRIKPKTNGANGSMSDRDRLFGPTSLMARVKAEAEGL